MSLPAATTPRLFIAADLPAAARGDLAAVQDRLKRRAFPVRWVEPAALHLTLVFLGTTDAALLPAIGAALRTELATQRAVRLQLEPAGAFPSLQRPRVVWAGIGGETAALGQLYARVVAALAPLDRAPDAKPFRPHITLGRVRRDARPEQAAELGVAVRELGNSQSPVSWAVDQVVVYRSDLQRAGPRYMPLETIALGAAAPSARRSEAAG